MRRSIAIVGGGAAGIFAALGAAHGREHSTLTTNEPERSRIDIDLLERNPRLGIKILISGGGKCNITHLGSTEAILKEGFRRTNEQRFLKHAFYAYTNQQVLDLLSRQGVPWHARENDRIFPDSGRADDVLSAFERELAASNILINTSTRVAGIAEKDGQWQIELPTRMLTANELIVTTGGISYSKTGTTGDGLRYATILDHSIVTLRSALAPIYLATKPAEELQGVALRDVQLLLLQRGAIRGSQRGDVLITHNGLSGPATLDLSREAAELLEQSPIEIGCNLLGMKEDELAKMLIEIQQTRSVQQVATWLEERLPNRVVPYVLHAAGIPPERKWNALTKAERATLLRTLLVYPFGAVSEIPIERGEVTAGGVSLRDIDPKTMMSRKRPGLYFAGEMLDVAGEIGGYNLQAAYSTGWLAGRSAMKRLLSKG